MAVALKKEAYMVNDDAAYHQLEKAALVLERWAVVRIVDLARQYRQAVGAFLATAYGPGGPDRVVLNRFADAIGVAEDTLFRDPVD